MRIVILISSLKTGGAERATVELSKQWTARDHEVIILTIAGEEAREYAVPPGVRTIALNMDAVAAGPIEGMIANIGRCAAVRSWVKRLKPDVVIGMMDTSAVLVALSCIGLPTLKIGCERTSPGYWVLPRSWSILRPPAFGLLDLVTVQTKPAADWVRHKTAARRVLVIPNLITWPLPSLEPRLDPAAVCRPERHRVLAVGSLSPVKRFELLIAAFARAAADHPDWDLVIVGEGGERGKLEEQVRDLGLADRVFLPGRAGNPADWYERASIFALTSAFEGFPNVLLEAMAYGLPAISVDCPYGPADIIRDDENGCLVATGTAPAFAERLTALMSDEAKRRRLSEKAIDVRRTYCADTIMAQWDAAFRRASGQRDGASGERGFAEAQGDGSWT